MGARDGKRRQRDKLRELANVLIANGHTSLDAQAKALGLPRSTVWAIFNTRHKIGLSSVLIRRMLSKSDLHPQIRAKVIEYAREKASGAYGHSARARQRWRRMQMFDSG